MDKIQIIGENNMVNINEEKSVNILTSTDKEKVIKNFSGA